MKTKTTRLYFIDALRAFAILMMLQGHFIDGLLDVSYRNDDNILFATWKYFRGITAPVFFTVSGFIFVYLLIRQPLKGFKNPRVLKGIKRGLLLIGIGYLLRFNIFGLFVGEIYESFYMVDVLQCIGLSILLLIGLYLYTHKKKGYVFPTILVVVSVIIFLLEPWYSNLSFSFLPKMMANYFTKANGSVFTIFPWFGYMAIGALLASIFHKYKHQSYFYTKAIGISFISGLLLLFSSTLFLSLFKITEISFFLDVLDRNYLFTRLGNVLVLFAIFMLLRNVLQSKTIFAIGQNTLSIYVIHFIILYGSFTGLGLYKFFHHELHPYIVIPGALLFVALNTYLSFRYNTLKPIVKEKIVVLQQQTAIIFSENYYQQILPFLRRLRIKILTLLGFVRS